MNNGNEYSQPQLGPTFYPSGNDDFYYMPEVVSPAPQRSMQEVPEQIQNNLAQLELGASSTSRLSGLQSPPPMRDHFSRGTSLSDHNSRSSKTTVSNNHHVAHDQPSFSPFPPLQNRPATVPPSDVEQETILENARVAVLNSNDPEMQLIWAQDALAYVEVAIQNELRISDIQAPRSSTPRIEHQLKTDAINVVSFLADQHHPKAEFIRGTWLDSGKFGFRTDKREAYQSYCRAAQNGYVRAEYRIGLHFENENDIVNAIKHYLLGVEARDAASHYRLGMMTLLGQHGQTQDFYRGIELIRFSADAADENAPQGAYVYGMLQARELPQVNVPEKYLPLNISSARHYIEKAAFMGFAKAQSKMGSAYELCQLGCDFDPVLSLHYNNLAARQCEPEAEMAISKWFLSGYEGVFRKNEELAFTYARRAAQSGLPTAEFAMGYFFEIGIYKSVNLNEARVWYGRAAEHGSKDAAARIEGITRSKTLSRKDHERIAVAKIKSHRVSQQGNRPDRFSSFTPATPATPAIPSQYIKMPDMGETFSSYATTSPYSPSLSTASAVSPLPTPSMRPASSIGISPYARPMSAAATSSIPMDNSFRTSSATPIGSQRPYSIASGTATNHGSIVPTQRIASGNLTPLGFRQSSNGSLAQSVINKPVIDVNQKPLPTVDIGFMAPLDPSGADRPKRSQKSDNPYPGSSRPPSSYSRPPSSSSKPSSSSSYNIRPDRIPSRPPVISTSQTYGHSSNVNSLHTGNTPAPTIRPSRHESLPVKPENRPASTLSTQIPPPLNSVQTTPAAAPSSSSGRKPGKGPSTFEEMGVPQSKKEDDCIVM